MKIPKELLPYLREPVAILGWGISGQSVANLLECCGILFEVYDSKATQSPQALIFSQPPIAPAGSDSSHYSHFEKRSHHAKLFGLRVSIQRDFLKSLEKSNTERLVVYSPGLGYHHDWIQKARERGWFCLGELDFASLFWKGEVIVVTGTNGKTTLTELLVHSLSQIGQKAIAVGNIGYPLSQAVIDYKPYFQDHDHDEGERKIEKDFYPVAVCEVSSFQAEGLQYFCPNALLWTNIAEDHLDRHGSFENYFRAKWCLVELLKKETLKKIFIGESVSQMAKALGFILPSSTQVIRREASILDNEGIPYNVCLNFVAIFQNLLHPQHENYMLLKSFWEFQGYDSHRLFEALKTFSIAAHRLEKVATIEGVSYWNDSKATNFHATLAALDALSSKESPLCHTCSYPLNPEKGIYWIGGGKSKGGNLKHFARDLAKRIDHAYLIGEIGDCLSALLCEEGITAVYCETLDKAMRAVWHDIAAQKERRSVQRDNQDSFQALVLLSPGFSSLDQYESYADRGNFFKSAVLGLKPVLIKS